MKRQIYPLLAAFLLISLPRCTEDIAQLAIPPPPSVTGFQVRLPGITSIFSALAKLAMPVDLRDLFEHSTQKYCPGLPSTVPAAIHFIETRHGQNVAVSSAGAVGEMQFEPATWAGWRYASDDSGRVNPSLNITDPSIIRAGGGLGLDGDGDGKADPFNRADAIPSTVSMLCANGAPDHLREALYAYNHSEAYVQSVIEVAIRYSEPEAVPASLLGDLESKPSILTTSDDITATNAVLANPKIELTAEQRSDLVTAKIDRRIIDILNLSAQTHSVAISSLRSDHTRYVMDSSGRATGRESNHYGGRAVDVYQIDGQDVSPGSTLARQMVLQLASQRGGSPPSEICSPFYDLSCAPIRCFSNAGHQDHIHIGYDG